MGKYRVKDRIDTVCPFNEREIHEFLKNHFPYKVYIEPTGRLVARVEALEYAKRVQLLLEITKHAELVEHHPELYLDYSSLELKLWTFECQSLTARDLDFMKWFSEFYLDFVNG